LFSPNTSCLRTPTAHEQRPICQDHSSQASRCLACVSGQDAEARTQDVLCKFLFCL
jgi:hypothetical protein